MHCRQFPNRMVKVYTLPPPTSINPWLARNNECLQLTTALGEFCLIIRFALIFLYHGTGHPGYQPFLVNEEQSPLLLRITHLAWKIQAALVET